MENKNLFQKTGEPFLAETTKIETHHFHSKLLFQKPLLRQIEWRLQNGPFTKSGVLPVTALFFWKICFSFRTSWKELIWCTNDPNVHIRILCKRWSLILGCFSLWVSLKSCRNGKNKICEENVRASFHTRDNFYI